MSGDGCPYRRQCCYYRADGVTCRSIWTYERVRCGYYRNIEAAKELLRKKASANP